jgi:tRNA(His) 5'-end guanylyltransferase
MNKDDLGDRMKSYEAVETARRFNSNLPVYARIDGRSFSKFTRKMQRPYDLRLTNCMIDVTAYLVERTHANIGYVQSDEISLVWSGNTESNTLFFEGKIQKTCSVLASMSAAALAISFYKHFGEMSNSYPHFDCRVIQLPNKTEAANMFLWRAIDARKNAICMAARHFFSHRELQGLGSAEMSEKLGEIGHPMESYPASFRYGTWLKRRTESRNLTLEELNAIPEKYRPQPDTIVTRSAVTPMAMPFFMDVINREDVVFNDSNPLSKMDITCQN